MSDQERARDESLSPGQVLIAAVALTGMLVLAWLYIRWVIETREGKVVTAVAGAVFGVLWLFGAFADPATRPATAAMPTRAAPASLTAQPNAERFEAFVSSPGSRSSASVAVQGPAVIHSEWRRGRGGLELCTTIAGQTRCTPVSR